MASILKVDAMQGVTSAGDITITSEGGAATQSLQQGLAKAWANFDGTGTAALRDSFNVSSLTDNGTGSYNTNFTNNTNNSNYAVTTNGARGNDQRMGVVYTTNTTSSSRVFSSDFTTTSGEDSDFISNSILGDLA